MMMSRPINGSPFGSRELIKTAPSSTRTPDSRKLCHRGRRPMRVDSWDGWGANKSPTSAAEGALAAALQQGRQQEQAKQQQEGADQPQEGDDEEQVHV